MKKLLSILIISAALGQSFAGGPAEDSIFDKINTFIQSNVEYGLVDYAGIKSNPEALKEIVKLIKDQDLGDKSSAYKKAFWINAYNVLTINGIVEEYPVKSPMDIPGFFKEKKHKAAGRVVTLDDIENKIIRPTYNDPRIHFVLVCAAVSCPKLASFAYYPDKVHSQLDVRTKKTLNDPMFIRLSTAAKQVAISEIFKWYASDFNSKGQSFIQYINKYRKTEIPVDFKQNYYTYDWSLNVKKN